MKNEPGLKDKFAVYTYSKEQAARLLAWASEQTDLIVDALTKDETHPGYLECWQKIYVTNVIFAGGILPDQFGDPPHEGHPVDELRVTIRDQMVEANLDTAIGGEVLFKMFMDPTTKLTMHGVLAHVIDDWELFATLVRARMQDAGTEASNIDEPHPDPSDQTQGEHEEPTS